MKRTYYLFNPGRMSRKDNTLRFDIQSPEGKTTTKYLPIEGVNDLYIFGSLDANSEVYNFLGKQKIACHFFDYYEHYRGSFMPKDYLLAGKVQMEQTKTYLNKKKRLAIAREFIDAASYNILKNLKYYSQRGRDIEDRITAIEKYKKSMETISAVPELMGLEGNVREVYYTAFEPIMEGWEMKLRTKQPPSNEINALISFGNMFCYTLCLGQLYHTQLNPTISFLHEPGYRRYSLALDLAEIFKPIFIDRTIFKLINKKSIRAEHFERRSNGCFFKESGKKTFIEDLEKKLAETIFHRKLKKKVSYKQLVRLECYKLSKYILGIEENYDGFKIWW